MPNFEDVMNYTTSVAELYYFVEISYMVLIDIFYNYIIN
ncbi:conserved protein of unknown function [Limnospira indica PCC 8005]|uniref:Uncharacterized protein n=1 Tax=Limnospira indica PCC 8005 TaxID=376219 RepID=A0A9P1KBM0_9CYAN|nr:conserved protein of unknown function [Limnospira indica PCC 8005]